MAASYAPRDRCSWPREARVSRRAGARDRQHRRRVIESDETDASLRQRHSDTAGAASYLQGAQAARLGIRLHRHVAQLARVGPQLEPVARHPTQPADAVVADIHDEAARRLVAAGTDARRDDPRRRAPSPGRRGLRGPVQPVGDPMRAARGQGLGRAPERDDVVVDLAAGGNLHQLDLAAAPSAARLDPEPEPAMVLRLEVLIERAAKRHVDDLKPTTQT